MTKAITLRRQEVVPVRGRPDEVAAVLRRYHAQGHLLTPVDAITPIRHPDGTVSATVSLLMPVLAPDHRARTWLAEHPRAVRVAAWTVAAVATTGALFAAMLWLFLAVLEQASKVPGTFVGGLLVLAVAALIAARLFRSGDGHSGYGYHYTRCK